VPVAYKPLATSRAPKSIRDFIAAHIDMQFADVHAMLRLPLSEDGLQAGCNFACVSTLCGLIAGASTIFYRQSGSNAERFKGVLNDYYPWRLQPKGGASQAESVAAIYADYRNPLAHAWAVSTKEVGKHPNKRIIMDGGAKVLGVVKQALTEEAVAALEASTGKAPSWLTPVVVRNAAGGFDLYPHSLYWGTRRMVERLAGDRTRMQQTVALFATMTTPAP
jgi:hypothetical protein